MSPDLIVVIPARGGSKRVPRKNIRELCGKPLLAYAIGTAQGAGLGGATFVSTEDEEIAAVALLHGAKVVVRPKELASDTASTESALLHTLAHVAEFGWKPKWVVTLPPTNPLRRADTLVQFISAARREAVDCVFSVTETRGDFWRRDPFGKLCRLFPDASRRQQDREPLYEENSAIYVTRVDALRETGSILGGSQEGIMIDATEGLDINSERDLLVARALLEAGEPNSSGIGR